MAKGRKAAAGKKSRPAAVPRGLPAIWLAALLVWPALASVWWFASRGDVLAYGDAEAHLNIARKLWDNALPSYREIGTVWLPLPHLVMLPFTWSDRLYRTGLAGAIPSSIAWVLAGVMLFAAVRRLAGGAWEPAACALAVFATNPNLLYLAATPMTEPLFYLAVCGLLYALSTGSIPQAVFWTWCASMTRYEGWLLIPCAAAHFLFTRHWRAALVYSALASVAPAYWFAHNWWLYGDALEFYRGEWSPRAIYERSHAKGFAPFPGVGSLLTSCRYYATAASLALGMPLAAITVAGVMAALWKRWYWQVALLFAGAAFCVWGMTSGGGVEMFVPTLWPNSYYNTRYALSMLPLAALGAAAIVATAPRLKGTIALVLALCAFAPWIGYPRPDNWVVWKEGQVNGAARRAWTHEMAIAFAARYRPGDRVFYSFGDLTGVLREAQIPLRVTLYDGNELEWLRTLARPDLFLNQQWVLDFADGKAVQAARRGRWQLAAEVKRRQAEPSVLLLRRRTHQ